MLAIVVFCFVGSNIAKRFIKERKQHKKEYLSIMFLYPANFVISFFIIDMLFVATDKCTKFGLPYSLIIYWLTIIIAGIVMSIFTTLYLINKYKGK